jgi:hypothetical protein
MTIKKIEEVYLYVSEVVDNSAENIQALAFMDHSGIPFIKMMYNDASALPDTLAALNTWWKDRLPPLEKFPFITYVEVHDDIPARHSPVQYLQGIDNVKKIVDIYSINQSLTS